MKFYLDDSSELPNYIQLEQQIKSACLHGELKSGDQLPSIRALAKELSIAIITVKRVYDDLEKENIIELRQGKGAFIRQIEKNKLKHDASDQMEQKLTLLLNQAEILGISRHEIKTMLLKKLNEYKEESNND